MAHMMMNQELALMRSPLWTPLFALDRLNSWLRSEEPFPARLIGTLKPVIYWTKTQAILEVSKRWHIGMRRVMVKKECRSCNGTGTYIRWDDARFPCRNCEATGTATLKFIETTIGPIRWHTPSEKWFGSSLDVYVPFASFHHDGEAFYEMADGWQPLQKGRPLSLAEVHRDMMMLLRAWPHEVCFSIDFHHDAGLERNWRNPDLAKAEEWVEGVIKEEG